MAYKEYKANDNKVLLNVDTFTSSSIILVGTDFKVNLIEMYKNDANKYIKLYTDEFNKILATHTPNIPLQNTMELDENGVYVETENNPEKFIDTE